MCASLYVCMRKLINNSSFFLAQSILHVSVFVEISVYISHCDVIIAALGKQQCNFWVWNTIPHWIISVQVHNGSVAACQNTFLKEPHFTSLSI